MIYLCSPYTASDPVVRQARFDAACRATAELIRQGRCVFSPIAYSHGLCRYGLLVDWQFWQRIDLDFLAMCNEVVVLKLDGWQTSVGVQAEIAAARAMGKPVTFLEPAGLCDVTEPGKKSNEPSESADNPAARATTVR